MCIGLQASVGTRSGLRHDLADCSELAFVAHERVRSQLARAGLWVVRNVYKMHVYVGCVCLFYISHKAQEFVIHDATRRLVQVASGCEFSLES